MPKPRQRSRTLRRLKKRLPGGRRTTHFIKKANSGPTCASCGVVLQGVSVGSTTKTKKRPERSYGGVLCFNCLQEKMKEKAHKLFT